MGTLISILKFRIGEQRRFKELLNKYIGENGLKEVVYDELVVKLEDYVPFRVKMRARFLRIPNLISHVSNSTQSSVIKVEFDVPIMVEYVGGVTDFKKQGYVELFFYQEEELNNVALAVSNEKLSIQTFFKRIVPFLERSVKNETGEELPKPQRIRINTNTRDFLSKVKNLGSIGWVYVSQIRDTWLRFASLGGKRLEESEVVHDITKRGAVSAMILENRKGHRVIISGRGTIYMQQDADAVKVAYELKDLIREVVTSNLFVFE